jgi:hypothetical protein
MYAALVLRHSSTMTGSQGLPWRAALQLFDEPDQPAGVDRLYRPVDRNIPKQRYTLFGNVEKTAGPHARYFPVQETLTAGEEK